MSVMSDIFLCGGDCVEDVNRSECHLRESLEIRIPTSHRNGSGLCYVTQFIEDSHYRIVVQRTKEKDSTPDLFGERYTYRFIITNDWDSEEKIVIETYNKRGGERTRLRSSQQ